MKKHPIGRTFRAGEIRVASETDAYVFDIEFRDARPAASGVDTPLIRARVLIPVLAGESSSMPALERARLLQQALKRIL